jgi:predicted RNase H-like HicB family nuclease
MSGSQLLNGLLVWQLFCLFVGGGILFLVIRLLIIKNFPRKVDSTSSTFRQDIFPVVITWNTAHHAFLAKAPDLSGCVATGATKAEALAASDVAIQNWLANARKNKLPVPTPNQYVATA